MSQLSVEWMAIDKRVQLLIYFISKKKEMVPPNRLKNCHEYRAMCYTKHLISITYADIHH